MNITTADYFTFSADSSLLLVGKSGCGKSVLCEALFKRYIEANSPDELRFVILDMTCVDAEILRDEHPEYIEELVEGTHPDEAFDVLEKYAVLAKTGRKGEKSQLFIFIEECNLARIDQNRYDTLISEINSHAKQSNMKLIYSTSVIGPKTVSKRLQESFDLVLVGHQYDSKAREYLGVPDTDDYPEHSFIVLEGRALYTTR